LEDAEIEGGQTAYGIRTPSFLSCAGIILSVAALRSLPEGPKRFLIWGHVQYWLSLLLAASCSMYVWFHILTSERILWTRGLCVWVLVRPVPLWSIAFRYRSWGRFGFSMCHVDRYTTSHRSRSSVSAILPPHSQEFRSSQHLLYMY